MLPFFRVYSQSDPVKKDSSFITSYFYSDTYKSNNAYITLSLPIENVHNYLPRNTLGNIGLPLNSLEYLPAFGKIGFNYSRNVYESYFFDHQSLRFYNTRSPYTDILYVMGSKKEQVFKGVFSYNVKPNWNVSAYFNRLRAEGFYLRQNVNQSYIALSSHYEGLNKRYALIVSAIYNDAKNSENGGIKYDTAFTQGGQVDKKILEVNLDQAKRSMLNRSVTLQQFFNLGRRVSDTVKQIVPAWQFILNSSYSDNNWRYSDEYPGSGFYSTIYLDSVTTNDKIFSSKIENTLSFARTDNMKHRGIADWLGFSLHATHQLIAVKQNTLDTTYSNIIAGGRLFNTYVSNGFSFAASGNYVLNGYNKEDLSAMVSASKEVDGKFNVELNAGMEKHTPDFIYSYYNSNNFYWENALEKTEKQYLGVALRSGRYRFGFNAGYSLYKNIPYFDNYAIARQFMGSVGVFSAQLQKDITLGNWHLDNRITYNFVPDSVVIRLPEFVLNHSLYYENDVFKKAMRLKIGFSVFYTTSYYANAYMPATAQFYIQDQKKYGNYPFVDFFICARIRSVNAFLKIEHVNSGLMGNTYIQTPYYPTNDRAFKVGVSWRFFD